MLQAVPNKAGITLCVILNVPRNQLGWLWAEPRLQKAHGSRGVSALRESGRTAWPEADTWRSAQRTAHTKQSVRSEWALSRAAAETADWEV